MLKMFSSCIFITISDHIIQISQHNMDEIIVDDFNGRTSWKTAALKLQYKNAAFFAARMLNSLSILFVVVVHWYNVWLLI